MITALQFREIRRVKKLLFAKVIITIGTSKQAEWARDLVDHQGLSEDQAVKAVNLIARGVQQILDKI
jgi:hypothetical protein